MTPAPIKPLISSDDLDKLDIRVGTILAAEDVAKVALLMAALPGEVNLYEATILPNHMRSFIGRG